MANKLGMYGETPQIKIGSYTISDFSDKENEENVWIEHSKGEGAEFSKKSLESIIEAFYKKHF